MLESLCLVTEFLIISGILYLICTTVNCATLNNFKYHIFLENWNWKPETCYARE